MNYKEFFEERRNACVLPRWEDLPEIDLYMDQVITLMNMHFGKLSVSGEPLLTSSMINNYVKNAIIPPPVKKKYSRTHLIRLIMICVMKPVLSITDIGRIIDDMLKTQSEEEVLNSFAEQYENEYRNTLNILETTVKSRFGTATDSDSIMCFSIMHAAAISSSAKLYAESALAGMGSRENTAEEKPKKEKKRKPAKTE